MLGGENGDDVWEGLDPEVDTTPEPEPEVVEPEPAAPPEKNYDGHGGSYRKVNGVRVPA